MIWILWVVVILLGLGMAGQKNSIERLEERLDELVAELADREEDNFNDNEIR